MPYNSVVKNRCKDVTVFARWQAGSPKFLGVSYFSRLFKTVLGLFYTVNTLVDQVVWLSFDKSKLNHRVRVQFSRQVSVKVTKQLWHTNSNQPKQSLRITNQTRNRKLSDLKQQNNTTTIIPSRVVDKSSSLPVFLQMWAVSGSKMVQSTQQSAFSYHSLELLGLIN